MIGWPNLVAADSDFRSSTVELAPHTLRTAIKYRRLYCALPFKARVSVPQLSDSRTAAAVPRRLKRLVFAFAIYSSYTSASVLIIVF